MDLLLIVLRFRSGYTAPLNRFHINSFMTFLVLFGQRKYPGHLVTLQFPCHSHLYKTFPDLINLALLIFNPLPQRLNLSKQQHHSHQILLKPILLIEHR